jgi:hypothetical protein
LQRLEDQHIPLTKDVIQVDNKNDERNKLKKCLENPRDSPGYDVITEVAGWLAWWHM